MFFNKLQDVLDFKMTDYGKKKFRDGEFNPVYYAFADNNILYDTNCVTQSFNDFQNGAADFNENLNRPKIFGAPTNTATTASLASLLGTSIIGSSELGNQNYPAFEIKLHNGHFTGSPSYSTGTFLNEKTPLLEVELKCVYDVEGQTFDSHEYLLLEINELNGLFERENFDFKLFRRKNTTFPNLNEVYTQEQVLKYEEEKNIFNNENFNGNLTELINEVELAPDQVNYWLEISIDEKILEVLSFEENDFANIYLRPDNNQTPNDC